MSPQNLRESIPALDNITYLNTGMSGPSPRPVVEAVTKFQAYHEYVTPTTTGMYEAGDEALEDVRRTVADLLEASPDEVALTQSTTDGINLVASALDWNPGETVLRTDIEHPAGILPWARLRDTHDINVEVVESNRGRIDLEAFRTAVKDARLACISSIAWNYGTKLRLKELTEIAHDHGTLVLVDAAQSAGQTPIDVRETNVDFLAGVGHKWLLGPWGSGFLFVSNTAREKLTPIRIGSRSVLRDSTQQYEYVDSAKLFEVSTMPVAIYKGLETAIQLMQDIGFDEITAKIASLTNRLKTGIGSARLLSPPRHESGIVSFTVDNPDQFVSNCKSEGIVIRSLPYPECVRASVHVFNTESDIDALLAQL